MKFVMSGGSGQVGQIPARHLHARGHVVAVLSRRRRPAPWSVVSWDGVKPGEWIAGLQQSDVRINLAGRSVNCRYAAANRRTIYESRIHGARLLSQAIASLNPAPRLWINASAAAIYRHALDRPMNEAEGELGGSEPGAPDAWKFSIDVARGWEEAFSSTATPLTLNLASPNPLPNSELMRALRQAWGVRFGLPSPERLSEIDTLPMRTESELLLKSRRVAPSRLSAAGFQLLFREWPSAPRDLVGRRRRRSPRT